MDKQKETGKEKKNKMECKKERKREEYVENSMVYCAGYKLS